LVQTEQIRINFGENMPDLIKVQIRALDKSDNAALASIIRSSIEALNLPTEGTAHSDPTTDDLAKLFTKEKSRYFVVEQNGQVLGGCGIYPSLGLPDKHAELVRFFLDPKVRGLGYGKLLMKKCEEAALQFGYTHLYLESFPEMEAAIHLYESFGYKKLTAPLGNTGHFACNVWMLKALF
jgi:putative acetyltransferase